MKFKSSIYTQVSGSVGGLTYGHNRGGLYARSRTIPTDPNTTFQQPVRAALASIVNRWTNLITAAERAAWDVYAANVPVLGALGDPLYLSGQQHYVRSNIPRQVQGLTLVDAAPTTFDLGEFTPFTVSNISAGSDDYDVNFTDTDDWCDENDSAVLVYSSPPFNVSRTWYRGPYRFADTIDGNSVTPPTSPATISSPFALATNEAIAFHLRVTRADGRLSMSQYIGPETVGL